MMRKLKEYIKEALLTYYPMSEIKWLIKIIYLDYLEFSQTDIYLDKDIKLSEKQNNELRSIIERLQNYEPIQYILGTTEFFGLKFHVSEGVLIPRPETEELVDLIVHENRDKALKILDVGTGSGCIALSLAKMMPNAGITAWDVSETALNIAMRNAESLDLKVNFERQDIFEYSFIEKCFDLIVSNPPYVLESEKNEMEHNVLDWEPASALFVPDDDPLLFYRAISELGLKLLNSGGKIYFEINRAFGQQMRQLVSDMGYHKVQVIKDLSGNDRILEASI